MSETAMHDGEITEMKRLQTDRNVSLILVQKRNNLPIAGESNASKNGVPI